MRLDSRSPSAAPDLGWRLRPVADGDRAALAVTLLDAYRGTIDDEGETPADAVATIDDYLGRLVPKHSLVLADDEESVVAMSFVVVVNGLHYIDPVATIAAHKAQGLGAIVVDGSISSLARSGVRDVGAVITDGNVASERLFARLGFRRRGAWG